jgi:hypothetical protein
VLPYAPTLRIYETFSTNEFRGRECSGLENNFWKNVLRGREIA